MSLNCLRQTDFSNYIFKKRAANLFPHPLCLLEHPGPSYLLPSFHFIPFFTPISISASLISFAVIHCMTHWHYINLPWFPTSPCALFKSFNVYIDLLAFHIHLHLLQTQILFSDIICISVGGVVLWDCIVSLNTVSVRELFHQDVVKV